MQVCEISNCSVNDFFPLAKDYYGDREPLSLGGTLFGHAGRILIRLGGEAPLEEQLAALFFDTLSEGKVTLEDLRQQGLPQETLSILNIIAPTPGENFLSEEKIQNIANSGHTQAIKVALAHILDHLSGAALSYAIPKTSEQYFAAKKTLLARLPQAEYHKLIDGNLH